MQARHYKKFKNECLINLHQLLRSQLLCNFKFSSTTRGWLIYNSLALISTGEYILPKAFMLYTQLPPIIFSTSTRSDYFLDLYLLNKGYQLPNFFITRFEKRCDSNGLRMVRMCAAPSNIFKTPSATIKKTFPTTWFELYTCQKKTGSDPSLNSCQKKYDLAISFSP